MIERSDDKPCLLLNEAAGSAFKVQEALWRRIEAQTDVVDLGAGDWRGRMTAAVHDGRRVIAAGGDGTIHSVANALLDLNAGGELAVLPAGTGNDLARGLGIPIDDLEAALDLALYGKARAADAVAVTRDGRHARYFINVCYGGFGERVADQIDPDAKARWGLLPHWIQLARQVLDMPAHEVEFSTPEGAATLHLHGFLLANGCYLGGGVPAAPSARLDDGRVDVALVPVQSLWERFVTSVDFLRGQLDENSRTLSFVARECSVRASPELNYTMDGESAPDGPLSFDVRKGALKLVPADHAPAFQDAE